MSFTYGGWARLNGVSFQSDDYTIHATRKNGEILVDYSENETANKVVSVCDDVLSQIPLIRGIWLLIYNLLNQWKFIIVIFSCACVLAIGLTFLDLKDKSINDASNLITIQFYAVMMIILAMFIKFSNIGKYHAAEHMSSNAYDHFERLTLADIAGQSRIHERCGTNLLIYTLFLAAPIFLCIHSYSLSILLGQSIGYELFLLKSRDVRAIRLILFPFYQLGRACQYIFFTSKPRKEHLEVAQAALRQLIELERTIEQEPEP